MKCDSVVVGCSTTSTRVVCVYSIGRAKLERPHEKSHHWKELDNKMNLLSGLMYDP